MGLLPGWGNVSPMAHFLCGQKVGKEPFKGKTLSQKGFFP